MTARYDDAREAKRAAREARLEAARSDLRFAAMACCDDLGDEAWRELCRARATLRALVRWAS
jgi:hypothetical protein